MHSAENSSSVARVHHFFFFFFGECFFRRCLILCLPWKSITPAFVFGNLSLLSSGELSIKRMCMYIHQAFAERIDVRKYYETKISVSHKKNFV